MAAISNTSYLTRFPEPVNLGLLGIGLFGLSLERLYAQQRQIAEQTGEACFQVPTTDTELFLRL